MKNITTCGKCKTEQEYTTKEVHQDIEGKFIVCNSCESFVNVEPLEEDNSNFNSDNLNNFLKELGC